MKKKELLEHWQNLKRKRKLAPRPVAYEHAGSTFDQDGIRITGSAQFIDAVLSRLTELLDFENTETRLQVSYQQATDKDSRRPIPNSYSCYIQVHERGAEAQMVNAYASAICGRKVIVSKHY